jgi:GDP-D-mannose dehydratase
MIHPFDVSMAIKYILNNSFGDDYLICGYQDIKMEEIIYKLFKKFNIEIIKHTDEKCYYDTNNNKILVIDDFNLGNDNEVIKINGYPQNLINLGWHVTYSINDILSEFD